MTAATAQTHPVSTQWDLTPLSLLSRTSQPPAPLVHLLGAAIPTAKDPMQHFFGPSLAPGAPTTSRPPRTPLHPRSRTRLPLFWMKESPLSAFLSPLTRPAPLSLASPSHPPTAPLNAPTRRLCSRPPSGQEEAAGVNCPTLTTY